MKRNLAMIKRIYIQLTVLFALALSVSVLMCADVRAQDQYLIEFYNDDDSLISSEYYSYGESIYIPDDPEKESDETYEYRFEGWGDAVHPICTKSKTYKAEYSQEKVTYNIRIVDYYGNCVDDYYCRQRGYYGDTLDKFANNIKNYLSKDIFIYDEIRNPSYYSSDLWKDFCMAVVRGDVSYDPAKQYECIGFTSLTDGSFYKVSDFYGKILTREENFRISFAEKEAVDSSECDYHYYYIADYDPDDPTRELSYDEIDTGKEVLSRHAKIGDELQMPLTIPYPESVTASNGQTYYLNKYRLRYYSDSLNIDEYDVLTDYSSLLIDINDEDSCYVLPVYEENETPESSKSMTLDMDTRDENGKYTGYTKISTYTNTYFVAPENPGYTKYDDRGFQYRIFSGRYRIVTGSNRTLDYVNAGEMVKVEEYWRDYSGGGAFLMAEDDLDEIMYDVRFEDYDGATFKQYHSSLYRKVYVPNDPVRDDDENYTYEFEGWRDKETGELVESINDRIQGSVTYVASYKATKVLKSSFCVSVPAMIILNQQEGCFSGEGEISVQIETNDESFYVDVIPDSNINLSGFYFGEVVSVAINQDKTRFKPGKEGQSEDSSNIYLASSRLPSIADFYEGKYSYEIRSGYDN